MNITPDAIINIEPSLPIRFGEPISLDLNPQTRAEASYQDGDIVCEFLGKNQDGSLKLGIQYSDSNFTGPSKTYNRNVKPGTDIILIMDKKGGYHPALKYNYTDNSFNVAFPLEQTSFTQEQISLLPHLAEC